MGFEFFQWLKCFPVFERVGIASHSEIEVNHTLNQFRPSLQDLTQEARRKGLIQYLAT